MVYVEYISSNKAEIMRGSIEVLIPARFNLTLGYLIALSTAQGCIVSIFKGNKNI